MEILQYDFMRHALVVGLLVSIACGIVGSYVVIKKIVFLSGSISHTAYGGIGLGYYLGISPIIGAAIFTIMAALGIGAITNRNHQREDALIGMMWAVGMAIGVIFVKLTPGYTADLMSYLFGSILTVPLMEIGLILVLDMVILAVVWVYYEEFKAIAFDQEYAEISGINTRYFNLLLLVLIALTVVIMIRAVGIILVIALLTIPATIAGQFTSKLPAMMGLSTLLGVIFTTGGLWLSYVFDMPSGATIILVAAAGFGLACSLKDVFKKNVRAATHSEAV